MKPLTKKIVMSVSIAAVTILTDISAQLITTGGAALGKTVLMGIFIGGFARIMGAVLSAISTTEG